MGQEEKNSVEIRLNEEPLSGSPFSAEEIGLLGAMMSGALQGKESGSFRFRHTTTRDGGKSQIISGRWKQKGGDDGEKITDHSVTRE